MFFSEEGISKEMLYPEFEAVLDGVVNLPELAEQQVRLAHVLINPHLQVQACVFFYLDFDEKGAADPGWNIPLRRLADRGEAGPDLGSGPIRLVSRSQCPVPWHQMHLWDPEPQDFSRLRDAAKRNQLGLLHLDEHPRASVASAKPASAETEGIRKADGEASGAQRQKTAHLIKQQRQHIQSLSRQHSHEVIRLKQVAEEQSRVLQMELRQLRATLHEQKERNASLEEQLRTQTEGLSQAREELARLLDQEKMGRSEQEVMRSRIHVQLEAREAELQRQIAQRDAELASRAQQLVQAQEEIARLKTDLGRQDIRDIEKVLGQLAQLGMVFVVYHAGAGHLTIPLQDIARYLANPMAYAAAKCFVGEEQYRQWLAHFQQPTCDAVLPSGGRCSLPIDRVDNPSRFVSGESNCCARHRANSPLRSVG